MIADLERASITPRDLDFAEACRRIAALLDAWRRDTISDTDDDEPCSIDEDKLEIAQMLRP